MGWQGGHSVSFCAFSSFLLLSCCCCCCHLVHDMVGVLALELAFHFFLFPLCVGVCARHGGLRGEGGGWGVGKMVGGGLLACLGCWLGGWLSNVFCFVLPRHIPAGQALAG